MEILMPRFYFHLASKDDHIPDDSGRELATLHDAYVHARKLIDKILLCVVQNQNLPCFRTVMAYHDAQMIVPFSVSHTFKAQGRRTE
jgi:hypothetical protein